MISALKDLIKKKNNSISIAQFMNFTLYDKQYGYYMNSNPIGLKGDFITAPEISQLFAETIAVWIILQWEKLGKPKKFTLAELGPGQGTMISDIMRITTKYFSDCVEVYLLEISPILKNIQEGLLSRYTGIIKWCNDINELPNQPTIFIANEFFDALPIRQFTYNKKWYENAITIQIERLSFIVQSTDKSFGQASENAIIEVNEGAKNIFNQIKSHINNDSGVALIIDYGYTKKPYISTLQAVKNHKYHNILSNIGEIDLTAHVNFSIFKKCQIIRQREFLHSYGIKERAAILLKNASPKQAQDIMRALQRLTHPELMGDLFKCAILSNYNP